MTEENNNEIADSGLDAEEQKLAETLFEPDRQVEESSRPKAEDAPDKEEADKPEEEPVAAKGDEDEEVKEGDEKEEPAEKIDLKDLEIRDENYISQEDVERIAKIVEERGLSKDVAQMLIDERSEALAGLAEAFQDQVAEERSEWRKSSLSDKEVGGENLEQTRRRANLFLDKLGTPEIRELIETGGFGDHPEVLRLLSRAGALIENDSSVIGGNMPVGNTKSVEETLFPSMFNNTEQ